MTQWYQGAVNAGITDLFVSVGSDGDIGAPSNYLDPGPANPDPSLSSSDPNFNEYNCGMYYLMADLS